MSGCSSSLFTSGYVFHLPLLIKLFHNFPCLVQQWNRAKKRIQWCESETDSRNRRWFSGEMMHDNRIYRETSSHRKNWDFSFKHILQNETRWFTQQKQTASSHEGRWSDTLLYPSCLACIIKGVVYDSGESLLVFALNSQTNTPLPSVLLQTHANNAQH